MTYEVLARDYHDLEVHRTESNATAMAGGAGVTASGGRGGSGGVYQYTEGQRRSLDALRAVVTRLRFKLVGVSELFNEIALPYKLWEICLLLLHTTHTENIPLATRLLRSVIYR
jgi:hypothetical protein